MTKQQLKNLVRRALGVRGYRRVQRLLAPRTEVEEYGCNRIERDLRAASAMIRHALLAGPSAIGKIGASELRAWQEVEQLKSGRRDDLSESVRYEAHLHCGVFPPSTAVVRRFIELYVKACAEIDVLAVWFLPGERDFVLDHCRNARLVSLPALEPYLSPDPPWSEALAGKRVLVVSPFARSIQSQFAVRASVWGKRPEVLPSFELHTLKAPLSDYLRKSQYVDWFSALDHLTVAMRDIPFDVALVGAGAFSLPLVAEAKRLGRVGIHTGGATQLLFGVLGGRWDNDPLLEPFVNEAWVRPLADERPPDYKKLENGCYW